jgi:hypothetical protein
MFFILAVFLAVQPPIACDLDAINHGERKRLHVLLGKLSVSAGRRQELPNGYAYDIDRKKMSFAEEAEWISLESRCCPFLNFTVELPSEGNMRFRLTGGAGVKEFVAEEMHKLPK